MRDGVQFMAATEEIRPSDGARIRVLVADDNEDVCMMLAALIDREPDLECVGSVGTADEVLAVAQNSGPQVVLLDLELGGGSGVDVLRRGRELLPGLAFVVFSGHTQPELKRRLQALGAADVLAKPDDLDVLALRIRAAVSA